MAKRLTYIDLIKDSLGKQSITSELPSGVTGTKISPVDPLSFLDVARLLIACFCRHPRRVLEQIQRIEEKGVEEVVRNLFAETLAISECQGVLAKTIKVWRGTVGEVLATGYVVGFTKYSVPIFKLRFAPNRRISMPGDDVLGFQFTSLGELACPPKIGPLEMRDSCRITTGGNSRENKKVFGGAGISDSPGG